MLQGRLTHCNIAAEGAQNRMKNQNYGGPQGGGQQWGMMGQQQQYPQGGRPWYCCSTRFTREHLTCSQIRKAQSEPAIRLTDTSFYLLSSGQGSGQWGQAAQGAQAQGFGGQANWGQQQQQFGGGQVLGFFSRQRFLYIRTFSFFAVPSPRHLHCSQHPRKF